MSQITSITIGGSSVALSQIEYAIQITHGRSSVTDSPNASTASLTFIGRDNVMPSIGVAQTLNIKAYSKDRFTGRITDLTVTHIEPGFARIQIQAIGKVSRLGTKTVGFDNFPQENAHGRALSIMQLSGEDYLVEGGYDMELNAFSANDENILQLLSAIADDVGAAVVDTPDGKILVQYYDSRGTNDYYEKWNDQGNAKWSQQTLRWVDRQAISPTAGIPLQLDGDSVIYEPIWRTNSASIINKVVLGYDGSHLYTVQDTASQTSFGLRTLSRDTELHDLASATLRAGQLLNRQSQPRWSMGSVEIWMENVTDTIKRDKLLALTCGNRVVIDSLPRPAPYETWVGVVEGWGETYTGYQNGEGTHRLTLALSDPFASYAGITWNAVPITYKWNTINSTVIWANAITQQNLV
jgi:hypothetical protein